MRIAAEDKRRTKDDIRYAACGESSVCLPLGAKDGDVTARVFCFRRYLDDQQFPIPRCLVERPSPFPEWHTDRRKAHPAARRRN